jgi:hypothetical protein
MFSLQIMWFTHKKNLERGIQSKANIEKVKGKHTNYSLCYKTPIHSSMLHKTKELQEKNSIW